jgi:hypothetical protein
MALPEEFAPLNDNGVLVTWGDERPDTSDPSEFVTELHASEPRLRAESVATIQVGAKQLKFRIRSIPKAELEEYMQRLRPKPSYVKDAHGKPLRDEAGKPIEDENSPERTRWYLQFGYMKVLLGLAEITLRDRTGAVVWQTPGDSSTQDMRAAVQALKDSGIATQHVEDLNKAIDALTVLQAEEQVEDLLGNSAAD